jgi:hypothetical protein
MRTTCEHMFAIRPAPIGGTSPFYKWSKSVPSVLKTSGDAERQAESDARQQTRKVDQYLERQARREAVPPLKRQVRETVPYLERQAARAAGRALAGHGAERTFDEKDA